MKFENLRNSAKENKGAIGLLVLGAGAAVVAINKLLHPSSSEDDAIDADFEELEETTGEESEDNESAEEETEE